MLNISIVSPCLTKMFDIDTQSAYVTPFVYFVFEFLTAQNDRRK